MRPLVLALVAVVAAVGLPALGCVEQGPGPQPKKLDPAYVQAHLLSAAPADLEKLDIAVGDVAIYLGNKASKTRIAPGETVTVTHYWKVQKTPGKRWKVFGLVRGAAVSADFMNLLPTDMQLWHGPEVWEPGELVEDVQTFVLRPDWRSKEATLTVGLIEVGKHGTLDRMEVKAPTAARVRDRAIVARVFEVDLSRAPPPKGTVHLARAQGPITIDGVGTDAGWATIQPADLVTAEGSADPLGKATVKMAWDDQYLYLFATIADTDIVSPFKQQDDPLWKGDCIELFVDADSNRKGYVELQVNPAGVTFDSWFAETRAKPGDEAWDSNMVAATKLRGTTEANDAGDQGWDVEVGIPWAAVKGKDDGMKVGLPPAIGDRWRLNIVRVDRKSGGDGKAVTAASWNRITMADFHALDRMLVAVFADRNGSIIPPAPGTPVTPAPAPTTNAPQAAGLEIELVAAPEEDALVAELLDPSGVKLADKLVPERELEAQLRGRDQDVQLVVKAQPNVMHARATALLERARQAGFARLALYTQVDLALAKPPTLVPAGALPGGLAGDPVKGPLELVVTAAGGARAGDQALTDAELDRVLRIVGGQAVAAKRPLPVIVVRPEPTARYARVLAVLERARLAGFEDLRLGAPPVTIPLAAGATLEQVKDSLELEVSNAEARFGGAALSDEQLAVFFRRAATRQPVPALVLRTDPAVSYARIVAVVDRARAAGLTKLAFAAKGVADATPVPLDLAAGASSAPPVTPGKPGPDVKPTISVMLSVAGDVTANGAKVDTAALDALLRAAAQKAPETAVIVMADPGVPHAQVVRVLDAARRAGLTRLAIAVKP